MGCTMEGTVGGTAGGTVEGTMGGTVQGAVGKKTRGHLLQTYPAGGRDELPPPLPAPLLSLLVPARGHCWIQWPFTLQLQRYGKQNTPGMHRWLTNVQQESANLFSTTGGGENHTKVEAAEHAQLAGVGVWRGLPLSFLIRKLSTAITVHSNGLVVCTSRLRHSSGTHTTEPWERNC